jgi:hypothetical protein
VRGLRAAGFDVVAVVEKAPGSTDERVIELARVESRIVLTEDRDFGRLVFAAIRATSGVIYIRFPAARRAELASRILIWCDEKPAVSKNPSPWWGPAASASGVCPADSRTINRGSLSAFIRGFMTALSRRLRRPDEVTPRQTTASCG